MDWAETYAGGDAALYAHAKGIVKMQRINNEDLKALAQMESHMPRQYAVLVRLLDAAETQAVYACVATDCANRDVAAGRAQVTQEICARLKAPEKRMRRRIELAQEDAAREGMPDDSAPVPLEMT